MHFHPHQLTLQCNRPFEPSEERDFLFLLSFSLKRISWRYWLLRARTAGTWQCVLDMNGRNCFARMVTLLQQQGTRPLVVGSHRTRSIRSLTHHRFSSLKGTKLPHYGPIRACRKFWKGGDHGFGNLQDCKYQTMDTDQNFTLKHSFMDDIARVANPQYVPTNRRFFFVNPWLLRSIDPEDIVKARIRTMGVEEHRFLVEKGCYPLYLLI